MNAIKPGTEQVRELSAKKLRELAQRDLGAAKYPLYCYFDEKRFIRRCPLLIVSRKNTFPDSAATPYCRFQMANLTGIENINADALKELSLK